jgi:hypothetical protein
MYPAVFPQLSASRGSAAQRADGNLKSAGPRFRSRAPPALGANLVAQIMPNQSAKIFLSRFDHEQKRMLMYVRPAHVCTRLYASSTQNQVGEDI